MRIEQSPTALRALVIGASGFVGRELLAQLGDQAVGTFHARPFEGGAPFDATNQPLEALLDRLGGAFTHLFAPFGSIDMEGCARDPVGTARTNVTAVTAVLDAGRRAGLKLVYVSTDYVFDGTRSNWSEDDPAEPRMAYGAQKLEVERWLAEHAQDALICRLSKVLSAKLDPENMLAGWAGALRRGDELRIANDQFFSPASVTDLAAAMVALAGQGARGLYHVAGPERLSRLQLFERFAAAAVKVDPRLRPRAEGCSLHEFGFLERRPLDTSLSTRKLASTVHFPFVSMDDLCARVAQAAFDKGIS